MKLGPFLVAVLTALSSCGYAPAYGGARPEGRLAVVAAPHKAPSAEALQALLAGARGELSRAGVLGGNGGYPRLVLQLLRLDERATGIAATPTDPVDPASERFPLARGSRVAVVGRAWIVERRGARPVHDTGDLRRSESYTPAADPRAEAVQHSEALQSAAQRLGQDLARRALGEPLPALE